MLSVFRYVRYFTLKLDLCKAYQQKNWLYSMLYSDANKHLRASQTEALQIVSNQFNAIRNKTKTVRNEHPMKEVST